MKRMLLVPMIALALPLVAQSTAAVPDAQKPVAVVNGETITAGKLDMLYNRLGAQMREQYEKNGGKPAFLENYLRKRLVVQEALKAGFDKRADVQADMEAAKESALFDRYVRDVVSANIVTDAAAKKYYDEHPDEFTTPEQAKVRHIVITAQSNGPAAKSKEQALERIKAVASELHASNMAIHGADPATAARLRVAHFIDLAKKYSEDGVGPQGGDLGWVQKGQLDPKFEEAAFKLEKNVPSGIVETSFGYHLILVEDRKPAGVLSFDEAKPTLREFLMTQHAADVVTNVSKLTNELRAQSKVSVFPENIK
jgi:parvulin-like peptidyl-prolyl isomerase